MYVHIGGMDLAGKTTVVNRFIASTNKPWGIRKKFLWDENPSKRAILLSQDDDSVSKGYMYLAALVEDIKHFQYPRYDTVQESCIILRSLAFWTVLGPRKLAQGFEALLPSHPKFDKSFILTADANVRLERLKERGMISFVSKTDALLVADITVLMEMEAVMVRVAKKWFGSLVIDTTSLTPAEVVELIHTKL